MVHKIPDAWGFKSSNPSRESVNMVGNMIELNNPTPKIENIAINPKDIEDINNRTIAPMANKDNTNDGLITLVK